MKKIVVVMLVLAACFALGSKTASEEYWYAIGNYYAQTFAAAEEDIDLSAFVEGMLAFKYGTVLDMTELNAYAMNYYKEKNLAAAESFLEQNGRSSGVVTTASGLQYKVLKQGSGKTPDAGSTVSVKYTLTLLDGTVVDSSSNNAVSFKVSNVIPGFAEAVMLMSPGTSVRAWVHPDLGYGASGTGNIQPYSLLIFDIELVSFN